MGRHIIVEKLDTLLKQQPLTKESEVVYLMVEIRKILDLAYDKKADFVLLRFYCDWTVHTAKDQHLENIKPVIDKMYKNIKLQIEGHLGSTKSPVTDFIYLEELKKEMIEFLSKESLPNDWCQTKELWVEFTKLLLNVLIDQPINNPTDDVSSFTFLEAAPNCIRGRINFTHILSDDDGTYDHYIFGNAY